MWPHLVIPFAFFAWNYRELANALLTLRNRSEDSFEPRTPRIRVKWSNHSAFPPQTVNPSISLCTFVHKEIRCGNDSVIGKEITINLEKFHQRKSGKLYILFSNTLFTVAFSLRGVAGIGNIDILHLEWCLGRAWSQTFLHKYLGNLSQVALYCISQSLYWTLSYTDSVCWKNWLSENCKYKQCYLVLQLLRNYYQ